MIDVRGSVHEGNSFLFSELFDDSAHVRLPCRGGDGLHERGALVSDAVRDGGKPQRLDAPHEIASGGEPHLEWRSREQSGE